ncbi:lysylphosphatidylglycerol synthase transmembrane domain-containing protein [Rhodohalobacter sp. 614A]|uniref:lysylphosphatidylglycerol synthase transmembrane domain-containing protein n=1 Tax=Rhodohalobacter sp. 614A TaxID=2908649 RepID=UPI001F36F375|nr:lysylphosphatidylglycerol synthase transmembrane domain-containing protein [Rhodohalobacter sp. 614A]
MKSKLLKITASLLIGGFFLWLAFRNVEFSELWDQISTVSFYWLPFFVVALVFSHYLRAERWRLLLADDGQFIGRTTLFAGVMLGYVVNSLVPRLGEISRPVYVARKEEISSGNLIGTIVAERFFDLLTMFFLILVTTFLLVSDVELLQEVFGVQGWTWKQFIWIPVTFVILLIAMVAFYKLMIVLDRKQITTNPVILRLISAAKSFGEGMISLRRVKSWPRFLLYTAGIWTGYIVMTYLPFYMMDMQTVYGLTFADGIVVTVVSSIGVSIPTPAAVGSYHLFIQQCLHLLYDVSLVQALTYATVTHAVTVISVFVIGPIALWWDKYYTLRYS